jgi:phosphatidylglycerol:prolipoprotein diacylglycerol transferase
MINFLHTFSPQAVLISFGPVTIYWYGLIMAVAMLAAVMTAIFFGRYYFLKAELIIDLAFWLILAGVLGARIYYVILEWGYYKDNWIDVFKIWQGGLAIHGGIIFGLLTLWLFARQKKQDFWLLASVIVPALALGQAIGRWGNYFNQELFGLPTTLPWGIPIAEINRTAEYLQHDFFHPTFLYESIGSLILFGFFWLAHDLAVKEKTNQELNQKAIVLSYLIFYSVLRFVLEEFRIDDVPMIGLWRWPQVFSAVLGLASLTILIYSARRKKKQTLNF